jgi:hypothetical protein
MVDILAWILFGATLAPAHREAYQSSRKVLTALVTVEVIGAVFVLLAKFSDDSWAAIAQEDGTVEWATFLAFTMAAAWLVVVVRKQSPSWWFKGACVLLAAFCVVVAGEEISWGQRLIGFKPPDVFLERNFQQELNLHNVLMHEGGLGFKLESKHLVIAIVLGFAVAWPLLVGKARVLGWRVERLKVFGPLAPPFPLAPIAIGIVAIQLDYPVELTGEGAELFAGLLFLASALVATDAKPRTIAIWLIAPLVAGALLSTVLSRIVFGSDEDGTRIAAAELAILQQDVQQGATDKLVRRSIHKRVYTATRDHYLRLAGGAYLEGKGTPAQPKEPQPRNDRRGYFLDPWNNPYWIAHDRKSHVVRIYSFGPNRRRDVAIKKKQSDPGDDVIVTFDLGERDAPSGESGSGSGSDADAASEP